MECRLAERETGCPPTFYLKMEVEFSSKTMRPTYQIMQCHIQGNCNVIYTYQIQHNFLYWRWVCWLFIHLTILVFIDCFYSLLDLVYMTCRPILYFLYFIFIVKFLRVCICGIYIFRFIGSVFLARDLWWWCVCCIVSTIVP